MAQVQPVIKCELDPTRPVPEICAVIMAVIPYHPGQEDEILLGVQEAIQRRRDALAKGANKDD
ncbi:hypothetical protein PaecuDRAFT_3136 [Paenibacillus curdlanolyticus YK9]|uniref:Uncharacterized protein n=1 Tax=Paenibacillus curdlanolyticus YK9 TaxID=717606 RepID=E0IBU7_9BACL|nr:hypothetical protein [Paenibacillus curdlanolyticus]EFM10177.1 hypothetical protein PaecuDRAFT_3136 [Paenibacillus curdlanolyticus YK9]